MATKEKPLDRKCAFCKLPFKQRSERHRFCSTTCRVAAHYTGNRVANVYVNGVHLYTLRENEPITLEVAVK